MADTSLITLRRIHTHRTFHAFQNRSYRLLWPANFLAYTSRWMQMTLLVWLVLTLTGSPWLVALVGFFSMAPILGLGVLGGVLADRVDRKRLMVATLAMNLAATLAMTVMLIAGAERYWHAYLVIAVTGAGWALDQPSRRSLILDMVGRSWVTNAVALDSVAMHASKMLGPALAGALIAALDVKGGYVVVTVLYVAALALLLLMAPLQATADERGQPARDTSLRTATSAGHVSGRERERHRTQRATNVSRSLVEAFRYARGHPTIRAVILITVLMNLLLFPYMQMVPVIARDTLGVGPGLMGVLMATDGLGALTGGVLIASARRISYHGRLYAGGSMVALLALLLFSFSRSYSLSLPILLVLGLGTAGFSTMQSTIVMLVARAEMRGRALGVISLAIGAGPLGALMVGGIAKAASPEFAVGLSAGVGLVLVAVAALLMPALRRQVVVEEERAAVSL